MGLGVGEREKRRRRRRRKGEERKKRDEGEERWAECGRGSCAPSDAERDIELERWL